MSRKQEIRNSLRNHGKIIRLLGICMLIAGIFPGAVRAAIAVINTDDGSWDSGWGTPLRVDGDDGAVADDRDIDTLWVNTNSSSPDTYYFGLSTVSNMSTIAGITACVKVDCNGNSLFNDAEDKILELNPNDEYYEVEGSGSLDDTNASTTGEFIGRFAEAHTDSSGSISWAACLSGNPLIKAETRDGFCPDEGTLYDETEPRAYNIPTAVTLQSFTARAGGLGQPGWLSGTWSLVSVMGGLVLLGTVTYIRRQ